MTCLSATKPTTLPYYTTREYQPPSDAADYWSPKRDPDGVLRDRSGEREQYIEDMAEEVSYLNEIGPSRILDIGCGMGWLLSALSDDWDKHGTETSKIGWECSASRGIYMWSDELQKHPYDEFYDVIVCHHVIEHVTEPCEMVRQIHRLLKPSGHLLMATPDFDSPCAQRFGRKYRMLHDETHVSLFTLESMSRFLRDFGFAIGSIRFPFPDRYATSENMDRWLHGPTTGEWSPPWPGNWMTFYARKNLC